MTSRRIAIAGMSLEVDCSTTEFRLGKKSRIGGELRNISSPSERPGRGQLAQAINVNAKVYRTSKVWHTYGTPMEPISANKKAHPIQDGLLLNHSTQKEVINYLLMVILLAMPLPLAVRMM